MSPALRFLVAAVLCLFLPLSALAIDTDRDTLPDAWELAHSRNPLIADYQVSAGRDYTCVLDDTGVHCWGDNLYGQLDVPVLTNPVVIEAGLFQACALDDTGAVCWGGSTFAQTTVPTLVNPRAVSSGSHNTCALDDTGVVCWGPGFWGLNNVPPLVNPVAVSVGGNHICALDDTGVKCWGAGTSTPGYVIPVLLNPVAIDVTDTRACALDDNGVKCWGAYNEYGQNDAPALADPIAVSSAAMHSCALDTSGVKCWGAGTTSAGDFPELGQSIVPALLHPVAVNAGVYHTCALDDTGVVCWGNNDYGKINVQTVVIDPDGDGIDNKYDNFPLDVTTSGDMDGDSIDNIIDADIDGDSVLNSNDNCRYIININQLDMDADGLGDVCENNPDTDGDGFTDNIDADDDNDTFVDEYDNCRFVSNPDQLDSDQDYVGDACSIDDDFDFISDKADNCPTAANANQLNTDGDAQGDMCDADDDNDTMVDTADNCPLTSNANQFDTDGDGLGDLCDSFPLAAYAASLDRSFDPLSGANNAVAVTALQADNKILIGGYFTSMNGVVRNYIARLNADGSVDLSFNPGTGASSTVDTIAVQADGKILIGGNFTSVSGVVRNHVARLNTNGSLDLGFNPGTGAGGISYPRNFTVAVQADGKIIIGGNFTTVNDTALNRIARLNANGLLDTTFNPGSGPNDHVATIDLQPDGKIVIAGGFTTVNGIARNRIARLHADGSLDTTFNPGSGPNGGVAAIDLQPDGKIVIAGGFTTVNNIARNRIARLHADGSLDASFNPGSGADSIVSTASVQADGRIIIGGAFTTVNSQGRNYIARLNQDGSVDSSFNPGTGADGSVRTIAVQSDGRIVVGGSFSTFNGIMRNYIARIHSGDQDGDAIQDAADKFPLNPTESFDNDNDSIGDNADTDDDNDLMPDVWEIGYSLNPLDPSDVDGDSDNDGISNLQEYSNGSNPTTVVTVKNDYTNSGIAGWYWKGQSNGNETYNEIWQLTFPLYSANWAIPNRFYPPPFADQANWDIVTTGDFNKDGDADILWRNNSTAQWRVWQMQNGTRVAQNDLADFDLAREWVVVGAGDTDKDGDDDVILNNTATGEVLVWQMQDHALANTYSVGSKAGYALNRIGDFNKDGDVDLLFRQNGGDVLVTWELEANAFVLERALANTGIGYSPVCAGDFDGDGDDDIMLLNSATTQEKWFVMENYTRTQSFGSLNTGFVFQGCGDYDGDGDADMKSQRISDSMNRIVLQTNVLQPGLGVIKQTVYTNPYGGVNPDADGYGFIYRGNSN